jgi:hypothetical protein
VHTVGVDTHGQLGEVVDNEERVIRPAEPAQLPSSVEQLVVRRRLVTQLDYVDAAAQGRLSYAGACVDDQIEPGGIDAHGASADLAIVEAHGSPSGAERAAGAADRRT